ncbi:MAG: hypothetical protein U0790_03875 [Isosphaeraceae bacterium]
MTTAVPWPAPRSTSPRRRLSRRPSPSTRRSGARPCPAGWQACGIPEALYSDHGSDFTSRHLEQVAADLKIRLIHSAVGEPRGRGKIERFFETITQVLLSRLPGYEPAGTPPAAAAKLGGLAAELERFLVEDYHVACHSETGVAPQERWGGGGFLPRMPESLELLDLLLLTVARARRVHTDGIRFSGMRYIDPTLKTGEVRKLLGRHPPGVALRGTC